MSQSKGLCPSDSSLTDFAYPAGHALHRGNYPRLSRSLISDESDIDRYDRFPLGAEEGDSDSLAPEEINRKAVALFDFQPENDNEIQLSEGQEIWISYRHGQGWLVAENPLLGENGLVPEEYVSIYDPPTDEPKPFIPRILQDLPHSPTEDSEWEDTDFEDDDHSQTDDDTKRSLQAPHDKIENQPLH